MSDLTLEPVSADGDLVYYRVLRGPKTIGAIREQMTGGWNGILYHPMHGATPNHNRLICCSMETAQAALDEFAAYFECGV